MCVGGAGGEGEGGCISKQQNLSRAMRDWDLMHEEEATLSTMCNTHTMKWQLCTGPGHKTTATPPDMHTRAPPTHHQM